MAGSNSSLSVEITLLLQQLDFGYDRQSWHGPNLKGSLRGITSDEATWRPAAERHCVADIAIHAAYWKYAARRRLVGAKRGSFPLKGSNWFALPDPLDDATWRGYLFLLESEHRLMRAAVAALPLPQLDVVPRGSKVTNRMLIQGMAAHDVYHAGQVQLLKKLGGLGRNRK